VHKLQKSTMFHAAGHAEMLLSLDYETRGRLYHKYGLGNWECT